MPKLREFAIVGHRDKDGKRNIGGELAHQMLRPGVADLRRMKSRPKWIMTTAGFMGPDGVTPLGYDPFNSDEPWPDVTFICLPSSLGKLATKLMLTALARSETNVAVTAEKDALANPEYFVKLRDASDNFRRLGKAATLGGGTRLEEVARPWCRDRGNITQIHLVPNGTKVAITSGVARGMSLGQSADEAVALHYAEPDPSGKPINPYDVLRAEAMLDVTKKVALFHNYLGLSDQLLDWRDMEVNLSNPDISKAMNDSRNRLYIASMYSPAYLEEHKAYPEEDVIGLWTHNHYDNWRIVCGYQSTESSPLSRFRGMSGPGNGVIVGLGPAETDGIYGGPLGPGAGLRPTVNAMLDEPCILAEAA